MTRNTWTDIETYASLALAAVIEIGKKVGDPAPYDYPQIDKPYDDAVAHLGKVIKLAREGRQRAAL